MLPTCIVSMTPVEKALCNPEVYFDDLVFGTIHVLNLFEASKGTDDR